MSKKKGSQKTGGRKKGTPNKVTQDVREWINSIIHDNAGKLETDILRLDPKERWDVVKGLLPYVVAKKTDEPDGSKMPTLFTEPLIFPNEMNDENP